MADKEIYPVNDYYRENGLIDETTYFDMYRRSIEDGEAFWGEQAAIVDWFKPFTRARDVSFDRDDLHIRWYDDGELNVSYNCLDRHIEGRGDDTATTSVSSTRTSRPSTASISPATALNATRTAITGSPAGWTTS
jgi:acetyl-CoA synthetase